ncbi:hypothetical protein D3C83_99540 [compost metagenome]
MKPRLRLPVSSGTIGYGWPEEPYSLRNTPWMMSARPKVSSSPYRWSSLYSCFSISRSITMPSAPTTTGTISSAHQ